MSRKDKKFKRCRSTLILALLLANSYSGVSKANLSKAQMLREGIVLWNPPLKKIWWLELREKSTAKLFQIRTLNTPLKMIKSAFFMRKHYKGQEDSELTNVLSYSFALSFTTTVPKWSLLLAILQTRPGSCAEISTKTNKSGPTGEHVNRNTFVKTKRHFCSIEQTLPTLSSSMPCSLA